LIELLPFSSLSSGDVILGKELNAYCQIRKQRPTKKNDMNVLFTKELKIWNKYVKSNSTTQ
jgi:hypothetical protein